MYTIIVVLHIFAALFLVLVVLLQTGKGAAMGSAFGTGGSQTVFGSSGAGNFLTKLTSGAAVIFMLTSLSLATLSSEKESESIVPETEQIIPKKTEQTLPSEETQPDASPVPTEDPQPDTSDQ
ncbi:MAG: preprotein translocase subunit SecG [Nitrospinales bacterium]